MRIILYLGFILLFLYQPHIRTMERRAHRPPAVACQMYPVATEMVERGATKFTAANGVQSSIPIPKPVDIEAQQEGVCDNCYDVAATYADVEFSALLNTISSSVVGIVHPVTLLLSFLMSDALEDRAQLVYDRRAKAINWKSFMQQRLMVPLSAAGACAGLDILLSLVGSPVLINAEGPLIIFALRQIIHHCATETGNYKKTCHLKALERKLTAREHRNLRLIEKLLADVGMLAEKEGISFERLQTKKLIKERKLKTQLGIVKRYLVQTRDALSQSTDESGTLRRQLTQLQQRLEQLKQGRQILGQSEESLQFQAPQLSETRRLSEMDLTEGSVSDTGDNEGEEDFAGRAHDPLELLEGIELAEAVAEAMTAAASNGTFADHRSPSPLAGPSGDGLPEMPRSQGSMREKSSEEGEPSGAGVGVLVAGRVVDTSSPGFVPLSEVAGVAVLVHADEQSSDDQTVRREHQDEVDTDDTSGVAGADSGSPVPEVAEPAALEQDEDKETEKLGDVDTFMQYQTPPEGYQAREEGSQIKVYSESDCDGA